MCASTGRVAWRERPGGRWQYACLCPPSTTCTTGTTRSSALWEVCRQGHACSPPPLQPRATHSSPNIFLCQKLQCHSRPPASWIMANMYRPAWVRPGPPPAPDRQTQKHEFCSLRQLPVCNEDTARKQQSQTQTQAGTTAPHSLHSPASEQHSSRAAEGSKGTVPRDQLAPAFQDPPCRCRWPRAARTDSLGVPEAAQRAPALADPGWSSTGQSRHRHR